jgi:hypothetical protein
MLSLFPEINEKIARLEEIQSNPEYWEEVENLNKQLIEID